MPHLRERYALHSLLKKLKFSPVVAIQGVRQSGKSTLAREILPKILKHSIYRTFDSPSVLDSALQRPESFLENLSGSMPAIIDEAQKAPRIFDAIKYRVDQDRRPGQYLLLGSTEFSKLMRIRESLTGRLSRLRLYPLLSGEVAQLEIHHPGPFFLNPKPRISRKDWLLYLHKGGMPTLFATRNEEEWRNKSEDWIALTVERDAQQIPSKKVDSARLLRVLREIAINTEPEVGRIAKSLRLSSVVVKSLVSVLETLFVVHRIEPHPAGTGKARFYLCDVGLATALGATFERQTETAFYVEQLAKLSYLGLAGSVQFSYFRSPKGSLVHGVWEQGPGLSLLKLFPTESLDEREVLILKTTRTRLDPKGLKSGKDYFLWGGLFQEKIGSIQLLPWEALG